MIFPSKLSLLLKFLTDLTQKMTIYCKLHFLTRQLSAHQEELDTESQSKDQRDDSFLQFFNETL